METYSDILKEYDALSLQYEAEFFGDKEKPARVFKERRGIGVGIKPEDYRREALGKHVKERDLESVFRAFLKTVKPLGDRSHKGRQSFGVVRRNERDEVIVKTLG